MSYDYQPSWRTAGEFRPAFIHRGNFPARRDSVTIEKGQKLTAGAILGRKTASGKYVLCSKTAKDGTAIADGSEKPVCILQHDADATDADRKVLIFRTGAFLGLDLNVGSGHTVLSVEEDLILRCIFIDKSED
jgi:hypothetical protein